VISIYISNNYKLSVSSACPQFFRHSIRRLIKSAARTICSFNEIMCGRFTNRLTWREIVAFYRLTVPVTPERNLPGRYNICPTTTIDAVIGRDAKRELVAMRWGARAVMVEKEG
jgi:hypothetical protein